MTRRSERSHELTPEERSRGGVERAARIQSAKMQAMAEGRPYKPTKRRRRRRREWPRGTILLDPAPREPAPPALPQPVHPHDSVHQSPALEERNRFADVLETMLSEVAHVSLDEVARRLREDDLSSVRRGADPRSEDDIQTDVSIVRDRRLPRVDSDMHADRRGCEFLSRDIGLPRCLDA